MKWALLLLALAGCAARPVSRPRGALERPELPHPCGVGNSPQGTPGMGCPEHYACRSGGVCEFKGFDWNGPGT